ncbi:hypothetical protein NDU88_000850 [Pleurodeles waltl]|uniref:Uncharacterized protein n=1 Tax=Pleurodeles waltl TaxID=8319 RepID=A0AAV7MM13_PLEWA|nr:hypothetical protein NDU88_000850 [Pleurodeles waltl]
MYPVRRTRTTSKIKALISPLVALKSATMAPDTTHAVQMTTLQQGSGSPSCPERAFFSMYTGRLSIKMYERILENLHEDRVPHSGLEKTEACITEYGSMYADEGVWAHSGAGGSTDAVRAYFKYTKVFLDAQYAYPNVIVFNKVKVCLRLRMRYPSRTKSVPVVSD